MRFSSFGQKFLRASGMVTLMEDLGSVARKPGIINLGGGNPSRIPAMEEYFATRMGQMVENGEFAGLIGSYDAPTGNFPFREALATLLCAQCGWQVGPENIALTTGSQTAFFLLFNLFAGDLGDAGHGQILLPLTPEYIGYGEAGLTEKLFVSHRPQIRLLDRPFFKHQVDFDVLAISPSIRALCVSRPTNPTGNVISLAEIARLSALAQAHELPLIIDNAYGAPFPHILYGEDALQWQPHWVICLSLSKFGLAGTRTGIVVANPDVVKALTAMNTVISLAPSSFGATLALEAVRSGDILTLSREVIQPHYAARMRQAVSWLAAALDGVEYYIHQPEGAFFLWLWFKDLPISCWTLYERLKARNVLILPGQFFFPGLDAESEANWRHPHECIRLSYSGAPEKVAEGIRMIGEEVRRAYS